MPPARPLLTVVVIIYVFHICTATVNVPCLSSSCSYQLVADAIRTARVSGDSDIFVPAATYTGCVGVTANVSFSFNLTCQPGAVFDCPGAQVLFNGTYAYQTAFPFIAALNVSISNCELRNVYNTSALPPFINEANSAGSQLANGSPIQFRGRFAITIRNCVFRNISNPRSVGGVIYYAPSSRPDNMLVIRDTVFVGCTGFWGGAVAVIPEPGGGNNYVSLINVTASDLIAKYGGVCFTCNVPLIVDNSYFLRNNATIGGAIFHAIHCGGATGSLVCSIRNTIFANNSAVVHGGAMVYGYAIPFNTVAGVVAINITSTLFLENTAGVGGAAVYVFQHSAFSRSQNNRFQDNVVISRNGAALALTVGRGALSDAGSSFINNWGGAVIGGTTFSGSTFINNTVIGDYGGGAINGSTSLVSCYFANNSAALGGAVYKVVTTLNYTVSGTTFLQNYAAREGGALYISSTVTNITIVGSTLGQNTAGTNGGALRLYQGLLTLRDATFDGNTALGGSGGAIYNEFGVTRGYTTVFSGNTAVALGGAFYLTYASLALSGVSFLGNVAFEGASLYTNLVTITSLASGLFKANNAERGAGVSLSVSSLIGSDIVCEGNNASLGACFYGPAFSSISITGATIASNIVGQGAVYLVTGVVYLDNCNFTSNIGVSGAAIAAYDQINTVRTIFSNNTALSAGGAVALYSHAAWFDQGMVVRSNRADVGGGIYMQDESALTTVGARILDNSARVMGGGMELDGISSLDVSFTTFSGNNAGSRAGAIRFAGSSFSMHNVVFVQNSAPSGGAIECVGCRGTTISANFTLNAANYGAALNCPVVGTIAFDLTTNVYCNNIAASDGFLQGNCSLCGCCTVPYPLTVASSCMLTPGRVCTFGCQSGYIPAAGAPATALCPASLVIDPTQYCSPLSCPALTAPLAGTISALTAPVDGYVVYGCLFNLNVHNITDPQNRRYCGANGWRGPEPYCRGVGACPVLFAGGDTLVDRTNGTAGDIATFTCLPGFTIQQGNTSFLSFPITCLGGIWYPSQPTCIRGVCPALVAPGNGSLRALGRQTDDLARFSCNPGYEMVGGAVLQCVAPAWNTTAPTCRVISCLTAPTVEHGSLSRLSGSTGDITQLMCDAGYQAYGASTGTCIGPAWTFAVTPTCDVASCTVPGAPFSSNDCPALLPLHQPCSIQCLPGYTGPRMSLECVQFSTGAAGTLRDGVPSPSLCVRCPAGRYSEDGFQCQPCVNGYTLHDGADSASLCLCAVDFFKNQTTGLCEPCPEGGECAGGDTDMVSRSGWYRSGNALVSCEPKESCTGTNLCADGYAGAYCAECAAGYYRYNAVCYKCDEGAPAWRLYVVILVLALAMPPLLLSAVSLSSAPELIVNSGGFNVFLNFIQLVSAFSFFSIKWGPNVRGTFTATATLNIDSSIAAPGCATGVTFSTKFYATVLLPIIVFAYFMVVFLPVYAMVRHLRKKHGTLLSRARDVVAAFLYFVGVMYLTLAQASLATLFCHDLPDGVRVLTASLENRCIRSNGTHETFPVGMASLFIYVLGYPLLIWALGYRALRTHGVDSLSSNQPISFLARIYRCDYWWFELTVMARKIFIVIMTVAPVGNLNGVVACTAWLFVSCLATAYLRPYKWTPHNVLECVSLAGAVIILFLGIVMDLDSSGLHATADIAAVVVIALVVVSAVGCVVAELLVSSKTAKVVATSEKVAARTHITNGAPISHLVLKPGATQILTVGDVTSTIDFSVRPISRRGASIELADRAPLQITTDDVAVRDMIAWSDSIVAHLVRGDVHSLWLSTRNTEKDFQSPIMLPTAGAITSISSCDSRLVVAVDAGNTTHIYVSDVGSTDFGSSSTHFQVDGSISHVRMNHKFVFAYSPLRPAPLMQWSLTGEDMIEYGVVRQATAFELGDSCAYLGTSRGIIHVYDRRRLSQQGMVLSGHVDAVTALLPAADGHLFSAARDGTVRIWKANLSLVVLASPSSFVSSLCLWHAESQSSDSLLDDSVLFLGTNDGTLAAHRIPDLNAFHTVNGTKGCPAAYHALAVRLCCCDGSRKHSRAALKYMDVVPMDSINEDDAPMIQAQDELQDE